MARAGQGSRESHVQDSVVSILYGFSFILYFPPADYAIPEWAFSFWRYLTLVFSIIFIFRYLTRGKLTRAYNLLMLYAFWIFAICSLIAGSDAPLTKVVYNTLKMAGMVSLAYYGLTFCKKRCLQGFIGAGMIMCTVNMVSVVLFSNQVGGMKHDMLTIFGNLTTNQYYFLGLDNFFLTYYLSLLSVMHYYSFLYKDSKTGIFAFIYSLLVFFMFLYLQSVTAIVTMGLFIASSMFISARSNSELRLPNIYIVVIVGVFVNLFIIISQNIPLLDFVNQYINKSASLIGRNRMWANAEALIAISPIVGNGVNDTWTIVNTIGLDHVHNIILQILYQGGVIGFALYLLSLVVGFFGKQIDPLMSTEQSSAIILLCILLYFLNGAMDYYIWEVTQYFVIALAASSLYENQQEEIPV